MPRSLQGEETALVAIGVPHPPWRAPLLATLELRAQGQGPFMFSFIVVKCILPYPPRVTLRTFIIWCEDYF